MVEPSEGNYEISQQGGKAIRHVLDRVLSEPVQPDMTTGSTDAALDTNILNDLELDEGMQFLNWLDHNVDYRQESWCNWLTFS